jgi:hypothetical protein
VMRLTACLGFMGGYELYELRLVSYREKHKLFTNTSA